MSIQWCITTWAILMKNWDEQTLPGRTGRWGAGHAGLLFPEQPGRPESCWKAPSLPIRAMPERIIISAICCMTRNGRLDAIQHWEASREADDSFATIHRNLALAYYNTLGEAEQARISLEKAFACNPYDAGCCTNWISSIKKWGIRPRSRLANLESHLGVSYRRATICTWNISRC